jgi:hypothetical protein
LIRIRNDKNYKEAGPNGGSIPAPCVLSGAYHARNQPFLSATENFPGGKLVYNDYAKALMLKAGIDKYMIIRLMTRTRELDMLRSTRVKQEGLYMKEMVWFINIYVGWVT